MNSKINPVLYKIYLRLRRTLGAEIVHRRRRSSSTCLEIIFRNDFFEYLNTRINTLKEAEACGYWVMCRPQSKRGKEVWHGKRVYQLFLSPVHPKKRNEAKFLAVPTVEEVSFVPIETPPSPRTHSSPLPLHFSYKMRKIGKILPIPLRI